MRGKRVKMGLIEIFRIAVLSCIVIKNARNTALDENKSKEVKVRRLESLGKVS